ncbi:MAG: hypothetical protein FD166_2126 [Bacteroidetes bacterium]|nr:MAG: hypothetical protein FD166_2126 [Bacteroidota bacterium]
MLNKGKPDLMAESLYGTEPEPLTGEVFKKSGKGIEQAVSSFQAVVKNHNAAIGGVLQYVIQYLFRTRFPVEVTTQDRPHDDLVVRLDRGDVR